MNGDGINAWAIIPARLGSTRLRAKMLLAESGRPLVQHTAENVARASGFSQVCVATDAEEIRGALAPGGIPVLMTDRAHCSGTDRVREAMSTLIEGGLGSPDVVVNVQGDEPELEPGDLERLLAPFADPECEAATLAAPIHEERDLLSPDVVKVVLDGLGNALYFSRSAIPNGARSRGANPEGHPLALRHVGVYAFRPAALVRFCELPAGRLEARENLEQLRWLESGGRMRVVEIDHAPPGIDTRVDYEAFLHRLELRARSTSDPHPVPTDESATRS